MSEVKRYYIGKYGLVEGEALGRLSVVLAADYDRVVAERDALHERLNATDQRNDHLANKVQCQFPQSCTTRCDCDIPDFSPGNGNKARRRAETILGFKVAEDPTMAPDTIRLCNCNQGRLPCTCKTTAYDGFDNGSD
ncbi:MAG: hypothetical protein ACRESJ_19655 [Pseudomonas sp.]|uniref:hypothetical protein n=1 Tax=Pseudomonas sp. TaxID=306 RepID=UPI003D6DF982